MLRQYTGPFLYFRGVGLPSGRVGLKFRADGAAGPVYAFLKWAQGALRRRHPSEEPGHIAQMERLFFYGKFSTMDEADWLRNEISICQNGLRTSKPGVQASPVTGKPLLASVAGHLNFQGVESPETVDAVGFQPTASILSAKVGGLEGIRTLDLSDANRTLSKLSYEPVFLLFFATFLSTWIFRLEL